MSLFEELKRRNVFRVGIAYVVGAWLVLQLAEVLVELLNLPEQVGPVVVAAVVIGFPVVLFAAWAYELTPQGIKRESEVDRSESITPNTGRKLNGLITVMLAVAVVYLLYDKFLAPESGSRTGQTRAEAARETEAAPAASRLAESEAVAGTAVDPTVPRESIAVLPFTNRSPVAEDEFFIDGIHDDLLTNLARIRGMKVISRTSVERFRDTDRPIPDIARELGVATVMEGAVQRAGDRVRINVQLIDANTDEHLWAEIYDRPLTTENLFDIQSEISEAIATALKTTLSAEESRRINERPTESLAAYNAYLRARRAFGLREIASMETALTEFRRAVDIDPEFAEAWAGIAQVTMVQSSWTGRPLEEGIQQATPALQRALALAPDSGEVVLAEAMALEGEDAEVAFQRALELMPSDPRVYQWYANSFEDDLEREQEGLALLRKAIELDPLDPLFRHQVARHLARINHYPEAERELRIALDLDPNYYPARQWMDFVMAGQGHLDQAYYWAEQATEADPNSPFTGIGQLFIAVDLRDRPRLEALVEALRGSDAPGWQQAMGEMALAALDRRYAAMLEIITGFEGSPFEAMLVDIKTNQHALTGQWPEVIALQRISTPGFFEPDAQRAAIAEKPQLACVVGYALRRTGDEELGKLLIESTIDYGLNELSRWVRHADQRIDLPVCQAAAGRMEEALEALETRFSSGGYQGWMFYRDLEPFEPLLGDPRFEALMQDVEAEMDRQRANLATLAPVEAGP